VARYVVVEFDDNDEADSFVNTLGVFNPSDDGSSMRVIASYMKPTQFCECPKPEEKSVRGKKYGLWVCRMCNKPHKKMWQSPRNLLAPDEKIAQRKMMFNLVEPRGTLS
jgi:ribosomal protein L37AE/L43A